MTVPGRVEAARLLCSLVPPAWFVRHVGAVAESRVARAASRERGIAIDRPRVEAAALLHDADKLLPPGDPLRALPHGEGSAAWLTAKGHPELSALVRDHPVTRLADATGRRTDPGCSARRTPRRIRRQAGGPALRAMAARFASWRRRYPLGSADAWNAETLGRIDDRAAALERGICEELRITPRGRPASALGRARDRAGDAVSTRPALAYLRGDDGYSMDRAADAIAERIAGDVGGTPDRWRTTGAGTTPAQVAERIATSPLFGAGILAIVTDPMPLLRSKADREALTEAIGMLAPGNGLVFLESSDGGGKRGAALEALETQSLGRRRDPRVQGPKEGQLAAWIGERAKERGIPLAEGAAKELATTRSAGSCARATSTVAVQGALAVNELEKLALYRPGTPVTPENRPRARRGGRPRLDLGDARRGGLAQGARGGDALDRLPRRDARAGHPGRAPPPDPRAARADRPPGREGTALPAAARAMGIRSEFRARTLAAARRVRGRCELEDALEGLLELDALVKSAPDAVSSERQRRWPSGCGSRSGSVARPSRRA
jgi:hypothetical protein